MGRVLGVGEGPGEVAVRYLEVRCRCHSFRPNFSGINEIPRVAGRAATPNATD